MARESKKPAAKKAVAKKSVAKKVAKKTPAKKAAKKPVAKKVNTSKKTTSATKRTTNSVKKKKQENKTERLKIATERVAKKQTNKFLSKEEEAAQLDITLPDNTSLRAKEKAAVIASLVTEDFLDPAWKISYVAGICFLIFGSFITVSSDNISERITSAAFQTQSTMQAQTIGGLPLGPVFESIAPQIPSVLEKREQFLIHALHAEKINVLVRNTQTGEEKKYSTNKQNLDYFQFVLEPADFTAGSYAVLLEVSGLDGSVLVVEKGVFQVTASQALPEPPNIDLIDSIDSVISDDVVVRVLIENAEAPKVYAVNVDTDETLQMELQNPAGGLYHRIFIPASTMPEGKYELYTKAIALDTNEPIEIDLDSFEIEKLLSSAQTQTTQTTTSATGGTSSSTTTGTGPSGQTIIADPVDREDDTPPLIRDDAEVRLRISGGELDKPAVVQIDAPFTSEYVRVYYRRASATQLMPLGYAFKGTDRWLYRFDVTAIPNGEYILSAKAKVSGQIYSSEGVNVVVNVRSPEPEEVLPPVLEEAREEVDTQAEPVRTFVKLEPELERIASTSPSITADDEAQEVLLLYREEINELLKKYAVAQQSGDTALIEAARKNLEEKKREMREYVAMDSDLKLLADRIDVRIEETITVMQERVSTFEELRKRDTNGTSALDTDGDGVSDIDERILYKTDPQNPDTDNDGVTDGVEIIKGFNPLDDSPEAFVRHESPKEGTAYVDTEVLKVTRVTPKIRRDVNEENPPVSAEISGFGIPDSYVTLYIFSTPTVVTVKTASDGSFTYTFEDELEDGNHEVYVAITDNAGAIVAQSNPFRFVKEAEAFTEDDSTTSAPVVSSIDGTLSSNPYLSVAGLGIFGLGLVLLMLGFGLRTAPKAKDEEVTIIEETPITA